MNLEELLKKPFNELTKEEVEWAFTQINWEELAKAYIAQQEELKRMAENNQDINMLHCFIFIIGCGLLNLKFANFIPQPSIYPIYGAWFIPGSFFMLF